MLYTIVRISVFDKSFKKLAKKYFSLEEDLKTLIELLKEDPVQGKLIGKNIYKIRLGISSKKSGKSGGARVISLVVKVQKQVCLLDIYDKSEEETLTDKELKSLYAEALSPILTLS